MSPNFASAAPSVSGTSGTITHGGNITIAGSGFGVKSPAAPLVWDDASGTNFLDKWSGGWPTTAAYAPNYRTMQRSQPMPHSRTSHYLSMANWQNGGYDDGWNAMVWKTFNFVSPMNVFLSYRMRNDTAFDSGDNYKFFDYSYGGEPYNMNTPTVNNWYNGINGGLTSGNLGMCINDDGASLRPWIDQTDVWWGDRLDRYNFPSPLGNWRQIETQLKLTSQNDGMIRFWSDGILTLDYSPLNSTFGGLDHWTDRYEGATRTIALGGYVRTSNMNDWWYFNDIYLDTTLARVIIGNAATFDACTAKEMQIPSVWSDTSITAKINLGGFGDTGSAYLYVVDSFGAVNTSGFPINLGSGVSDVVTPSAPTGLGVM